MLKQIFIIVLSIQYCQCNCSINQYDAIACILLTTDSNCMYDEFMNQCQEIQNQNLGCSYNLNRNACINQLTGSGNIEQRCIFQNGCREVNIFHLKNLGCDNSYSKYACLSVINKDCFWNVNYCEDSQKIMFSDDSKEEIYPFSVTPQFCAKYQKHPCMNSGPQGDYKCVSINYIQFKELKCSTLGLNQLGCISIQTESEMCLFHNNQCKNIEPSEITECTQKVNKLACLSIIKPNLFCQWKENECITFKFDQKLECNEIYDVNINVCSEQEGLCMFDFLNQRCNQINQKQLQQLKCDTPGLTKSACLSIKNQYCTFNQGFCQTLSEDDLSNYQCQSQLNQAACINIKTKGQLCLWNGQSCQNVEINQDLNCNHFIKLQVNGNVCQAITKPHEMCKYDEITKNCVQSSPNDYCTTPYLNLYGCVSITRQNQICQWIDSTCKEILVIPFVTRCSSLKNANYQACQQVYENNDMGCYHNFNISECVPLLISTDNENNKNSQEIQKANQFLATVTCYDISLGLNRVICGSITTENILCRWHQNSCKFVEKDAISQIPCADLKFANPLTCALVEYDNEFCRYFKQEKGCINQLKGEMHCNDLGLNSVSCRQAKGNCYIDNGRCLSLGEILSSNNPTVLIILQKLQCQSNNPTKMVCLEILTKGQLCQWSNKYQQCKEILVLRNKQCADFSSFQVNVNVCASIVMDNPNNIILGIEQSFEQQNPGYCEFDSLYKICKIKKKACTTKCCTENEEIGINAHSCSRFSSQEPGVYCYFDNFRCQELTNLDVDISNSNNVKIYYNTKKFTCAQMNKNSCHMIDWSTTQTCYFNGFACVNLNLKGQVNLLDFIEPTAILNIYACLSIEAVNAANPSQKYFEYNQQAKNCKLLLPPYPQYQSCESVTGNSNICLGLTHNLYCRWDTKNLKCVTITLDQQQEIINCNQNQNIKSCIENKYSACQFSLAQDKCIYAPLDQDCSYFNTTGKVSQKTCSLITKKGQICQFQNNYCVASIKQIQEGCDLEGINKRGCYKNSKGNCRWDDVSNQCYENKTALNELECSNNLNQILCMQVTKQPCMWNDDQFECLYFTQMTKFQYEEQNPKNQYNEWACTLIVGAGYTFDPINYKCKLLLNSQNFGCSDIQMNNYACQFLTKGSKCYFDQNEIPPNKKCKIFDMDQSVCSTNYAINIEVCMNIPKSCKFSLNTMSCLSLLVKVDDTCLELQDLQKQGEYVNKLGCASISDKIEGNDGQYQCHLDKEFGQQCNYQKFCFWDNYTCKISKQQIHIYDKEHYIIGQYSQWVYLKNNCTNNDGCNKYVTVPENKQQDFIYPGKSNNLICGLGRCDYTNEPCYSNADCENIAIENLQLNDDGSIKKPKIQSQICRSICQQQLDPQPCLDSETPPKEVLQDPSLKFQNCQGRCKQSNKICESQADCGQYILYDEIIEEVFNETTKEYYNITIPAIWADDQCRLQNYICSLNSRSCSKESDCSPIVINSWILQEAECKKQHVYTKTQICIGFYYLQLKCNNTLSKALCLLMTEQNCFFDLNQGGCIQLEGNEHKVPNCESIKNTQQPTNQCDGFSIICKFSGQPQNEFRNTCQQVSQKRMNCKDGSQSNAATDSCPSILRSYINCVKEADTLNNQKCVEIAYPSILNCAGAIDNCRYENNICVSSLNNNICTCDKSYSRSLCIQCNCNYDLLGYCQFNESPPPLLPDQSNKYYLCYEVNQLTVEQNIKKKVCGMVEQACRYTFMCEDATHYSCDYIVNFVVSKKACIRCKSLSVYYDEESQFCNLLNNDIKSCNLLNKQACLQKTKDIMCKWENYECKQIEKITASDSRECSIYNREACIQFSYHCWFDINIGYCTEFDPLQGDCHLLLNRDLCMYSLKQSCQWDLINNKCIIDNQEITQCKGLNKFGCLNQSILQCVWSDSYECEQAELNNNIQSCESPLNYSQTAYITNFSRRVCSSININQSCFLDNYYQCRKIIITDKINCDSYGLNRFGCINRSLGQCQFIDNDQKCIKNLNDQIGCVDSLNKWACISQKQTCKFDNNICTFHQVNTINDIINSNSKFAYSKTVCSSLDQNLKNSLIYSEIQNRCIDVSNRQPFIDNCDRFTTNKYSCQQKTLQTCEYNPIDNNCIKTSQQILKILNNCFTEKDLNWVSCISLLSNCKFNGEKCLPIDLQIDTCQYLYQQQYIVKDKVCAITNDQSCKLNVNTNTCEIVQITDNFQCSTPGLNKKSCIFQTKGYLCRFENDQCIFDFGYALCEDMINEEKCYSIRTKGQYCIFDQIKGCQQIDNTQIDLNKCIHSFKTNPITCSRSTDIACFYDIETKKCKSFVDNAEQYQSPNFNWDNSISFNKQACQRYLIEEKKVFWKRKDDQEECVEALDVELTQLKCDDIVNEFTCVNIQTPSQFCKYEKFICKSINLEDPQINKQCNYYEKVNSGAFCQLTIDVACEFDMREKKCQELTQTSLVECDYNQPQKKGYNGKACEKNNNCTFNNGGCYRNIDQSIAFCNDVTADKIQLCKQIITQGCSIISNRCTDIQQNNYFSIKCEEAVNLEGCIKIQTKGQTCYYDLKSEQCKFQNLYSNFQPKCLELNYINSYEFCVQAIDQSCKYNQIMNKCEVATGNNYDCLRELNKIACYNLTDKLQQCKFLNYCYGPNNKILDCNPNNYYDCCLEASSKESCLFQKQFKCQWQDKCQAYKQGAQNKCDQIKDASVLVCTSIQDSYCIFDSENFTCKQIIPQACDEIQTSDQCNRITDFPCIWDELYETCIYKKKDSFDQCSQIKDQNGNLKACTMIERSGQKCIFQNNQCETFYQNESINNCNSNLNIQSCLQQTVSQCEWVIKEVQIRKSKQNKEFDKVEIGECKQLTEFSQRECNSSLSYKSCISIQKIGSFCVWKNNQCQNFYISEYMNSKIKKHELASNVNPSVCGLYEDDRLISYSQKLASCIEVKDINQLSCSQSKFGLNQISCFHIQFELCKWNNVQKTCEQVTKENTNFEISCNLPGLNSKACTLINVQDSCGFIGNGCGKIDLSVNCKHQGLNKFGCLQITNYPCAWIKNEEDNNYHCDDYLPYDSCNNINLQVNSMVCSSVQVDACFYNKETQSCQIPIETYADCNIEGLNYIACSNIKGCYYENHKCQAIKEESYNCIKYPQAHVDICKKAQDLCKYSPLKNGCITSQSNEICKRQGLSQAGCIISQNQCFWKNNNCECQSIKNVLPVCDEIVESQKCKQFEYCIYQSQQTNNNEVNQQIEYQNFGTCRQKLCSDLKQQECQNYQILNTTCYLNNKNQCQQANSCEEVENPYILCSKLVINGVPCIQSIDLNSCKKLVCSELNKVLCEKFSLYCQYTDRCQTKQCSELYTEQVCRYYNCEWNKNTKECQNKLKCDSYKTQENCNLSSYDNIQCKWLENDNEMFCSQQGCQFLSKNQSCRNFFINNNICVQLKDESCVQCEEIKDLCLCLDQEYCRFNPKLNQCQSISCNNFINENQCLQYHFCEYNQENQACHFHCANHKNDFDCDLHSLYCYWNYELQICMQPEITTQVIIGPVINNLNMNLYLSVGILVFILS